MQGTPAPSARAAAPLQVDDRSTAFQAVEGGTQHKSGETLLVAAYAGIWVLLMLWVVVQWTRQTALTRRLDDLEVAIGRAAKESAGKRAD